MQTDRDSTENNVTLSTAPPKSSSTGTNYSSGDQSLGALFSELADDMSTLVRQEVQLIRTETMEKVSTAMRSVILLVAGGLVAYAGLVVVIIAAAIALGNVMPYWLSALIAGVVVIIIGAGLLMTGRTMLSNLDPVPEKTIETLKEDAKWAKEQVQ